MLDLKDCRRGDAYFSLFFSYLEYDIVSGTKFIECLSDKYIFEKEKMLNNWNHNIKTATELLEAISHTLNYTCFCPEISQERVMEAIWHANKYCSFVAA